MNAPTPSPSPRATAIDSLVRSILVGLGTGMVAGGGYLLFLAWKTWATDLDCSSLSPNECAFQDEALDYLARRQSLFGIALMFIGLSTFLMLRAKARAKAEETEGGTQTGSTP